QPVVAVQASTVDFAGATGEDPVDIPTSYTNFRMEDTGPVVLTFTATAKCEAAADGTGCPLRLLIDGYPTSTGKTNIIDARTGARGRSRRLPAGGKPAPPGGPAATDSNPRS